MGRPAKFDKEAAIDTIMMEIWKNGYEACSAKALSEKLGITRSSFYNAFGSREEAFREALTRYFEISPDRVLASKACSHDILGTITRLFKEVCHIRAKDPDAKGCLGVNCLVELARSGNDLAPDIRAVFLKKRDILTALLKQAARNGEIPDNGDLEDKAAALLSAMVGLNLMSKVVRSEDGLWASTKHTLQALGLYKEETQT